ncbi:MAG: hypothetical protein EXR72_18025 [Myxococcales bacterium]|nr:hypothetical protein [Myxococcales bacterium]
MPRARVPLNRLPLRLRLRLRERRDPLLLYAPRWGAVARPSCAKRVGCADAGPPHHALLRSCLVRPRARHAPALGGHAARPLVRGARSERGDPRRGARGRRRGDADQGRRQARSRLADRGALLPLRQRPPAARRLPLQRGPAAPPPGRLRRGGGADLRFRQERGGAQRLLRLHPAPAGELAGARSQVGGAARGRLRRGGAGAERADRPPDHGSPAVAARRRGRPPRRLAADLGVAARQRADARAPGDQRPPGPDLREGALRGRPLEAARGDGARAGADGDRLRGGGAGRGQRLRGDAGEVGAVGDRLTQAGCADRRGGRHAGLARPRAAGGGSQAQRRSGRAVTRSCCIAVLLLAACGGGGGGYWSDDGGVIGDLSGPDFAAGAGPVLTGAVSVIIEPDAGIDPILNAIKNAKTSIFVEVYLLTDSSIVSALVNAKKAGRNVRVILEQKPTGASNANVYGQLMNAGVACVYGNPAFTFTHAKMMIIDGSALWVMTLNLSVSAFNGNREYVLIDTDASDVAEAQAVFDADWNRTGAAPNRLAVAPETGRARIESLLNSATSQLDIEWEALSDNNIGSRIQQRIHAGVKVRIVVPGDIAGSATAALLGALKNGGAEVRLLSNPFPHAKLILVDRERGFIGSENATANSLNNNREVGVVWKNAEVAKAVGATFDADFAKGNPL